MLFGWPIELKLISFVDRICMITKLEYGRSLIMFSNGLVFLKFNWISFLPYSRANLKKKFGRIFFNFSDFSRKIKYSTKTTAISSIFHVFLTNTNENSNFLISKNVKKTGENKWSFLEKFLKNSLCRRMSELFAASYGLTK